MSHKNRICLIELVQSVLYQLRVFQQAACTGTANQNKKNYVFINQAMSWSSAQQYCRENYKDLAMIENQEENTDAQNTKLSNYRVWIGLYREPWTWSDGSKSSFRNWLPNTGLNNINENQHCITENPQHQWADESCNIPWVFVCHQGDEDDGQRPVVIIPVSGLKGNN
uniref:C-type lectin domain-containing protein n=1 Tax=Oryzias latipes TaxID=8090 RepID=A0A3P9M6X5_ORYLA